MTGKTLKELNAQVGDVVRYHGHIGCGDYYVMGAPSPTGADSQWLCRFKNGDWWNGWNSATDNLTIVSRAKKYTAWQFSDAPENAKTHTMPDGSIAWRMEVKPVVTPYRQGYKISEKHGRFTPVSELSHGATYVVELNLIDGIPDCASVKMVKL